MNIICNALLMIVLSFVIIKEYGIIQSYHYEFSKYLKHLKKNKGYMYFLYCLLGVFLLKFRMLFLGLVLILLIYLLKDYNLKVTKRVKRVLMINFILLTIMLLTDTLKYVFIVPFLYLLLVHYLSLLLENLIYLKFLKKAKKKVRGKFVIGITGSCGKTSTKNIIYDLMIDYFNVCKTPKSYNNRVGITKSINDNLSSVDDYFICEYGVDKVKGMDKLIKIVKPNLAIITEIGNQHLLSFKTQENILNEKMKLIKCLDQGEIGIINNDNELLRNFDYGNRTILRYGIEYDCDVRAKNVCLSCDYSEFDLYIKNKFIKRVRIDLLSRHSVENVLCGICVCLVLDLNINQILKGLKNIKPVNHRLEKKLIEGIEVIDDSFNSNLKGFKEAVDLVSYSDKYKIVITPGIIEQGDNNCCVSYEIGKCLVDNIDYVFLVSENSKFIENYFKSVNYSNYQVFKNFNEAFEKVKTFKQEKIVLIENDLPDIYLN